MHTVIDVLRIFKIRNTSDYVKKLLDENYDGDNLWGILSVLKIYGLIVEPNRIMGKEKADYLGTSIPFITEYENDILIIKEITECKIVGRSNGKNVEHNREKFFSNWSGIIVSIQKGKAVGEPNLMRHIRKNVYSYFFRIAIILCVLTMCIYRIAFSYVPFYICLSFILSILGAVMSYQIELSHYSPNGFINNLCSSIKHSACNHTLAGSNRIITVLGFSYFCSLCVFYLLPLNNCSLTNYIVTISLIEVVWSLAFQLKRKKFCINCIIVQTIVITMALIGIPHLEKLHLQDFFQQGVLFLYVFAIIFSVTNFQIRPYISTQYKLNAKCRTMDYFKKNYLENSISFENSTIKIFLNPFCNPCKEEFLSSYNLLVNQRQFNVIPIIIVSDLKGEKAGMSIINGREKSSILYILKEWYSWGYLNPKEFEREYRVHPNDEKKLSKELKNNLEQAHTYNVKYTPSIVYNDINLPAGITLVDVLTM